MAAERVRISLELTMTDDENAPEELGMELARIVQKLARAYGVDLSRPSAVSVTRTDGSTYRTEVAWDE